MTLLTNLGFPARINRNHCEDQLEMSGRYLIYQLLRHSFVTVPECGPSFGTISGWSNGVKQPSCFEAEQRPLSDQAFLIEQFNTSEIDLRIRVEEDSPRLT